MRLSRAAWNTIASSAMNYVVPPPKLTFLPVVGLDATAVAFPVHRIYCVGKNYADHAREMGSDPNQEPPCFFTKPADAAVHCSDVDTETPITRIAYPLATSNLHYEVELVVAIGKGGSRISKAQADNYIYGYGIGVDLTRRDLQALAKKTSRPWDSAKAFDQSAPMSAIYPKDTVRLNANDAATIWLDVNGEQRQRGKLIDMIWSISDIVSHLSHEFRLQPGDLILTGTPAGVGPLNVGDRVRAGIDTLGSIAFTIDPATD